MSENDTIQRCPHDSENPYTMVLNSLIRDVSISPNCRWLLIYLLSNDKGWKINIKQIIKHTTGHLGRDKIYYIIKEAIVAGYMKKEIIRESGVFKSITYYLSENPKFKKCLPFPEKPDPVLPDPVNQHIKNKPLVKKELCKKKTNNIISTIGLTGNITDTIGPTPTNITDIIGPTIKHNHNNQTTIPEVVDNECLFVFLNDKYFNLSLSSQKSLSKEFKNYPDALKWGIEKARKAKIKTSFGGYIRKMAREWVNRFENYKHACKIYLICKFNFTNRSKLIIMNDKCVVLGEFNEFAEPISYELETQPFKEMLESAMRKIGIYQEIQ